MENGREVIDVGIIKTMLEEKEDMNFEDFIKMLKSNIELSDSVMRADLNNAYFRYNSDSKNQKFLEDRYQKFMEDGHLSQNVADIAILQNMIEKCVKMCAPIDKIDFRGENSIKEGLCKDIIQDINESHLFICCLKLFNKSNYFIRFFCLQW